jgi:ribokinase
MIDVLNIGSINIDSVFRVHRIARPGETIASHSLSTFAGGKGANQSVALARAGVRVAHAGRIGEDGRWVLDLLAGQGVDVSRVHVGKNPTGQAIIQVDDAGQNAIVVSPGANQEISPDDVDGWLQDCRPGTWLLLQNETSGIEHAIRRAKKSGMLVAFNPAPADKCVLNDRLDQVDLLCLNEIEGQALSGQSEPDAILAAIGERLPRCEIVLTLGAQGAIVLGPQMYLRQAARMVEVIDATAAGDTFLGYYLAGRIRSVSPPERLELACQAATICVTRPGALESIPALQEVVAWSGS